MNTKVVPNPEQKGWEEDGTTPNGTPIYKWESGGGSGGSSLWEQNGDDIYYSDGNVGVGTDTPESKMNIIGDVNLGSNSDIGLDLMRVVSSIPAPQNHGYIATANNGAGGVNGDLLIAARTTGASNIQFLGGTNNTQEFMRINAQGKVGIGTDDPVGKLQVRVGTDLNIAMNQLTAEDVARISAYDDAVSASVPLALEGEYLKLRAGSQDRLIIDAAGRVGIGTDTPPKPLSVWNPSMIALELEPLDLTSRIISFDRANQTYHPLRVDTASFEVTTSSSGSTSAVRMTIDEDGDAQFSGSVDAREINRNGYSGIHFTTNYLLPMDSTGAFSTGKVDLGNTSYKFKNGYFSGTVTSTRMTQDGSPVIDAKGLISTLSTLRNATKDETTLEGLRDSIGNAIGGLIEKFENEIATMPAEDSE